MDKLVLRKPKLRNTGRGEVIRITDDAYAILAGFSAETGRSISFIASKMVEFAAEHTVVEEDEG